MTTLAASTGWRWVKDGFAVFAKQPMQLASLFLSYMLLMILIGIIPLAGQVLPLILLPIFSLPFLRASALVRQGESVHPRLLFEGFRSPARRVLLMLGGLQLLAVILALGGSALVDGGLLWRILSGQVTLDAKVVAGSNLGLAMLTSAALYIPPSMAFWYAAPLIAWQRMPLGKALFYSFFAVRREARAFLVYGVVWSAIGVILPSVVGLIVALLFNSGAFLMVVMFPLSLLLTVVAYCSFYATYADVFLPGAAPAPEPTA